MKTILFLQSSHCLPNKAMLAGSMRAAKSFGWSVRILEYGYASSNRTLQRFNKRHLLDEFRCMRDFWSPIGVIVDCGGAPKEFSPREFGLPTVFLDRDPSTIRKGAACVYSDAKAIGELAAQEILSLDAASLAYVPFYSHVIWSVNRGQAFAEALQSRNYRCHVFQNPRGASSSRIYLKKLGNWIRGLPKPTAIFAANDHMGDLVIAAATRCGFKVPKDVAILGVDNDEEICLRSTPSLSSIKPDHEKAGYLAAQLLRELISHPQQPPPSRSFGALTVIHRFSTRIPRRHDDRISKAMELIRIRATTGITVSELVGNLGVSRRLLELRFNEITGRTVMDAIQSVRLEHAKILLTQSDSTLEDIAISSGFPSVQSFRKAFAKDTGKTPISWRKEHFTAD